MEAKRKAYLYVPVILMLLMGTANAQCPPPDVEWMQTFGGSNYDTANAVRQTTDGGYVFVGTTIGSFSVNGIYLIKTNSTGQVLWSKVFDSFINNFADYGKSVQETSDDGFIIAGNTESRGKRDFYLIKTDSLGNEEWSKIYGELSVVEEAHSVQQTSDGGFVVVGTKELSNDDVYLLKTDSLGNEEWSRTFGTSYTERAFDVKQTSDGGYIIVGYKNTISIDFYLIKTDSLGNEEWSKTFGGDGEEIAYSVLQTNDGGYIVAGYKTFLGTPEQEFYIIKIDTLGDEEWSKTYGRPGSGNQYNQESAYSINHTADGGFILAGKTYSGVSGEWSQTDGYIVKINSSGNEEWSKIVGGNDSDGFYSVQQAYDSGFITAGRTKSWGTGDFDAWLVKLKNAEPIFGDMTADCNLNILDVIKLLRMTVGLE